MTKYGIEFSSDAIEKNIGRLTNQLWKLIPMRENEEDWQKQLNTVIVEITGFKELFYAVPGFLQLLIKLEGILSIGDMPFDIYRKTVFECISLLQELKRGIL